MNSVYFLLRPKSAGFYVQILPVENSKLLVADFPNIFGKTRKLVFNHTTFHFEGKISMTVLEGMMHTVRSKYGKIKLYLFLLFYRMALDPKNWEADQALPRLWKLSYIIDKPGLEPG